MGGLGEGAQRGLVAVLGALLPSACAGCGRLAAAALCGECQAALGGGLVLPGVPGVIESFVAVGAYSGVAGRAVRALKFAGRRTLALTLGRRLAQVIAGLGLQPDAVVTIPPNLWRRFRRGHDPALALAGVVASELGLPVERLLRRRRAGPPQAAVQNRRANVRGAFVAHGAVTGANLLVVDDVITTGATALEAALVLRQAGALRVWIAAVAHSRPGR